MAVGDLVRINDLNEPDPKRIIGTIIKYDVYDEQFNGYGDMIAEVLWNGGHISWILTTRLDLVNGADRKRHCTD
tara:strand:- start:727 stop:948 length:222 start_codon:yes stop_codon:yes gene_type:complete